jgi:hypothetical protein
MCGQCIFGPHKNTWAPILERPGKQYTRAFSLHEYCNAHVWRESFASAKFLKHLVLRFGDRTCSMLPAGSDTYMSNGSYDGLLVPDWVVAWVVVSWFVDR